MRRRVHDGEVVLAILRSSTHLLFLRMFASDASLGCTFMFFVHYSVFYTLELKE